MQSYDLPAAVPVAFGQGRLNDLGRLAAERLGPKQRLLLVADPFAVGSGLAGRVIEGLEEAGHATALFSDLASDPRERHVDACAEMARDCGANAIVALGGGSAMDVGKLAAALVGVVEGSADYALEIKPFPGNGLPVIAVPTTSGTGSEMTAVSVFSLADGTKVWASGPELFPKLALLDPEITTSLPASLTAATGVDALVHAIESMTNCKAHTLNDAPAMRAIGLIRRWLPRAVADGSDLEARGQVQIAACLAGAAIAVTGCAVAHGLGHALGTVGHVHHGRAVGLSLRVALGGNVAATPERHALVAEAFGLEPRGRRDAALAAALPEAYDAFLREVGLEISLAGDGLSGCDAARLAAACDTPENRPMFAVTCRDFDRAEVERLCRELLTAA
ncbi:MAG: iron-containing alcohol dehydrogenase [Kiloniellales bacterium]|nr:iron-containing alcohol dehydrogenase [Kiloniellales bacterium]